MYKTAGEVSLGKENRKLPLSTELLTLKYFIVSHINEHEIEIRHQQHLSFTAAHEEKKIKLASCSRPIFTDRCNNTR